MVGPNDQQDRDLFDEEDVPRMMNQHMSRVMGISAAAGVIPPVRLVGVDPYSQ